MVNSDFRELWLGFVMNCGGGWSVAGSCDDTGDGTEICDGDEKW